MMFDAAFIWFTFCSCVVIIYKKYDYVKVARCIAIL